MEPAQAAAAVLRECGARRSGRGKPPDLDWLAVMLGVPEVVLHLLGEPAFGAATESFRQPDGHLRGYAEAAVEQQGQRVARYHEPLRGLGHRQAQGFEALASDECARMRWIVHEHGYSQAAAALLFWSCDPWNGTLSWIAGSRRKMTYLGAGLPVGLNQVVLGLKVEPELRIAAEPMTEA